MNDLYLIGNGFDLAHGLETSYNHFLLWYLNNFLKKFWQRDHFEDELMTIDRMDANWRIPDKFDTIPNLIKFLEQYHFKRIAKHDFFEKLIKNYRDLKWVDIEYEYYTELINLYKEIESNPQKRNSIIGAVLDLNACFESIKNNLVKYLQSIEITSEKHSQIIEDILIEGNRPKNNEKGDKLYVYFNYTNTMDLYSRKFLPKNNVVHIHGKLSDVNNPIIFGYGDEMHPYYEKMENLNSNDFLKNIKSFGYFKTNNYQKILRFIEGNFNSYTVKILGHSCGISDRILLNTIFEHSNCKAIKIYYHKKSEIENDYFEKTQEISRHFKSSSKGDMRYKIVSFERSIPLMPFTSK